MRLATFKDPKDSASVRAIFASSHTFPLHPNANIRTHYLYTWLYTAPSSSYRAPCLHAQVEMTMQSRLMGGKPRKRTAGMSKNAR